jgi:type IV pilus assembly protein PilB
MQSTSLFPLLLGAYADFFAALIAENLLSADTLAELVQQAKEAGVSPLIFLIQQQKLAAKTIAEQLAKYLKLEFFDLSKFNVELVAKEVIDEAFIRQHQVLPLLIKHQTLYVAISEPSQLELVGEIKFHTDLNVCPVVVEWDKITRLIENFLSEARYKLISQSSLSAGNDDRIIAWVEHLLQDAIQKGTSDIHIEPYKTAYRIRFRLDGILHKIAQLPLEAGNRVVACLKVMARLDMAERRLPQDGRFSVNTLSQQQKDCRISICPTLFGEKIVVRILDAEKISLHLENLGLEPQQKSAFLAAITKPQGMVLVTGPTGSGKTITLYAALNFLNSLEKNICTVEDPVEITLPGINQVHVDAKIQLTFAKVLRSFLRQDPDVLMVGEIRDQETAETAIKAAQTGHLVFSTLHTNSAVETLLRLTMLGISPFNIAHSIQLIIAQRLLRKLCSYCQHNKMAATECAHCMQGYKGRVAVFECLTLSAEIGAMLIQGKSTAEIAEAAKNSGMLSLQEAALNKIAAGITSQDEVQRVIYG